MARDVFVVSTSESTESVTFVEQWESSQREVMNDSPGRVYFPSSLVRRLDDAVHANCFLVNCEIALHRSESFWSLRTKRLIHQFNK